MELTGLPAVHEGFEAARREPLNARAHIQTSLDLLARGARTRADIELAKSGFQTAARLAPDLWEPMVGAADAHYRLDRKSVGEGKGVLGRVDRGRSRRSQKISIYSVRGLTKQISKKIQ